MLKQFLMKRRINSLQKSVRDLEGLIEDACRRKAMEDEQIDICRKHISNHQLRIFELRSGL